MFRLLWMSRSPGQPIKVTRPRTGTKVIIGLGALCYVVRAEPILA